MFLGLDMSNGFLFFTANFKETTPQLYHFLLVPQAWTIGIEISFYLIAPFIITRKLKYILLFIALSILLRIVLINIGLYNDPWSYRFFPTELVFFLLGSVGYHFYKKIKDLNINKALLLFIFCFYLGVTFLYSYLNIPYKVFIYPAFFFLCLPFIFILSKKWKIDRWIGELSYPVYISHILVLMVVESYDIQILGSRGITLAIFTLLFSVLLNELVAKKIEVIRQRRVK